MPLTTPCRGYPYPEDGDPIDVAGDIERLALPIDTDICNRTFQRYPTIAAMNFDTPNQPLGTMALVSPGVWYSKMTNADWIPVQPNDVQVPAGAEVQVSGTGPITIHAQNSNRWPIAFRKFVTVMCEVGGNDNLGPAGGGYVPPYLQFEFYVATQPTILIPLTRQIAGSSVRGFWDTYTFIHAWDVPAGSDDGWNLIGNVLDGFLNTTEFRLLQAFEHVQYNAVP